MPRYVLKLDKEHDAYVIFSTIVDGVVSDVLTRDQMFTQLKLESPQTADELIEVRLVRADLSGSSSKEGEYGWDDGTVLFLDGGGCDESVPREQLYTYVTGKTEIEEGVSDGMVE